PPVTENSEEEIGTLETTVVRASQPEPEPIPQPPAPAPVTPPSPPEPAPVIIDDEVDEVSYGEIETSTALFGQLPLIETPFSVGVIDQEIIQERRAFTAEEALVYETSVTPSTSSGFYSRSDFSVRG